MNSHFTTSTHQNGSRRAWNPGTWIYFNFSFTPLFCSILFLLPTLCFFRARACVGRTNPDDNEWPRHCLNTPKCSSSGGRGSRRVSASSPRQVHFLFYLTNSFFLWLDHMCTDGSPMDFQIFNFSTATKPWFLLLLTRLQLFYAFLTLSNSRMLCFLESDLAVNFLLFFASPRWEVGLASALSKPGNWILNI